MCTNNKSELVDFYRSLILACRRSFSLWKYTQNMVWMCRWVGLRLPSCSKQFSQRFRFSSNAFWWHLLDFISLAVNAQCMHVHLEEERAYTKAATVCKIAYKKISFTTTNEQRPTFRFSAPLSLPSVFFLCCCCLLISCSSQSDKCAYNRR